MQRVAKFEKVSFEQFKKDWADTFYVTDGIEKIYEDIKLPKRATAGSAGYDFYAPMAFELKPGETIKIPTGIRVKINDGWVLKLYPRSGLGFKFRVQMNNTVGLSTVIIITAIMRDIYSAKSQTTQTKIKPFR